MISLGLLGLRGGCGVSSLTAALGQALHSLGQRVLLVDLCPENLLRLHGGLPFADGGGWARALLDHQGWAEPLWRLQEGLCLLPYGRLASAEQAQLERFLRGTPEFWSKRRAELAEHFDWLLFDLPQRLPGHAAPDTLDLTLRVLDRSIPSPAAVSVRRTRACPSCPRPRRPQAGRAPCWCSSRSPGRA